ncbi:MAG: hypothetical protein HF314_15675 [Ignavibacteria bacterium]|jgi:hypothetical protein|nr:hypothetical protein [Ignavibacteria bacterium]MCU7504519.1 hypothetical protein [Ignavibacteria bacterium]MCU7518438.1 hypothetical protein [Ignavibacteria bacterium]
MKIKVTILFLFIVALFAGTLVAEAWVYDFKASNEGDDILVEWRTTRENNLQYFAIERRSGSSGDFYEITRVIPRGSNSYYSYTDKSAYKPTDSFYAYRLAIYEQGGKVNYIKEYGISHSTVSGVRRTWGSIKAMFR